jgi:hypothetical protein
VVENKGDGRSTKAEGIWDGCMGMGRVTDFSVFADEKRGRGRGREWEK